MGLAVSLTQNQIEAAGRLHQDLPQWHLSDAALKRLRETLTTFDIESSLLKTVAINSLYGTQVFAIVRMAQHITAVMLDRKISTPSPELVESIAALPNTTDGKARRF